MREKKTPNTSNKIDEEEGVKKYVNEMFSLEGIGKAYKRLEEFYDQKPK
jgi:hypothetical protein